MWLLAWPWPEEARVRLPEERRLLPWYYRPADTARAAELFAGMISGVERHAILPWPAVEALSRGPVSERWDRTLLVAVVASGGVSAERVDEVLAALGTPHAMAQLPEPAEHGYGWQERQIKQAIVRRLRIELASPEHALSAFQVRAMPVQKAAALATDALDLLDLTEAAITHRLERASEGTGESGYLDSLWWAAGRLVAERLLRIRPDWLSAALEVLRGGRRYDSSNERLRVGAAALQAVGLGRVVGADASLGPLARAVNEHKAVLTAMRERIPELPSKAEEESGLESPRAERGSARPKGTERRQRAGMASEEERESAARVGTFGVPHRGTLLLDRVKKVLELQRRSSSIQVFESPPPFHAHLRVGRPDGVTVEPWGAVEGDADVDVVKAFAEQIDAPYRTFDPALVSTLVCTGRVDAREVVDLARAAGVRLVRFGEMQRGLMDMGPYLAAQTRALENDPVYPPSFYVDQRLSPVPTTGTSAGAPAPEVRAIETLASMLSSEERGRFVLVLGEFGAGKTFLLHELARRVVLAGADVWPVLVNLRDLEKARSVDVLLAQHFALTGKTAFDVRVVRYLLREGLLALLFDGFDELVPRVTYDLAAEHLETLLEAAEGKAKVIVTSRTNHFLSDKDVEMALARRMDRVANRQMFKLLPFRPEEIRSFLVRRLGSDEAAERRFTLLGEVTDLLGLSHNPRMLSFIAEIDEEKLREARDRKGQITKTGLYTLLVERWIGHEFERSEYRGVPTLLDPPDRWQAVLVLAEHMWCSGAREMELRQLPEDVHAELVKLGSADQDPRVKVQHVGSRTLLVRDEEGHFSFLHRSILEFAAAWRAALQLRLGKTDAPLLTASEITPLMAEFFGELATPETAATWAQATLAGEATPFAKKNAQRVLEMLSPEARERLVPVRVVRRGEDLRGQSFAGQDLRAADFEGADLSEAVLAGADLTGANLRGTRLARADLAKATLLDVDLRGADLAFAKLSGADLRGANLEGAVFRYASLIGATLDPGVVDPTGALGAPDSQGTCPPHPTRADATTFPPLGPCFSVAISPDGELLASGHSGGTVALWALGTGQPLHVWRAHEGSVIGVAFSPDGLTLASGSYDNSIRLWRACDGALLLTLQGHSDSVSSVAFSPDGLTLASGSYDNSIRLWRVSDGALLFTLQGHSNSVYTVALSPDGLTLASGSEDHSVRLWRVSDGALLRTLQEHSRYVNSVAFSPDGLTLASGSGDHSICLWRVSDGASLLTRRAHSSSVNSVAFSPDGLTLASGSGDHSICLWRVSDGASLLTRRAHSSSVNSVAFSPDGLTLASGFEDHSIRLWRVSDGASLLTRQAHSSSVNSVAFSPDGLTVVSGSEDHSICLWRVSDGASLLTRQAHSSSVNSVAFSPDGLTIASGSEDHSICLWRVSDGASLLTLQGHSDSVSSVTFSPDGLTVASGSEDHSIRLWRARDGATVLTVQGHCRAVSSVAFSPDGLTLASGSSLDNSVRLWRARDGVSLFTLQGHASSVNSVAFSPDGFTVASGSNDSAVRVWRISDGACLAPLRGHASSVNSVAFSPDGLTLASGSDDSSIRVWRISDGACLAPLRGHASSVNSVAFSPDGLTLASGSDDNSIRLWRVADGACLATLYATPTGWVAFTPDGRYRHSGDLQGSFWHVINLCRFEPGELDEYLPHLRMRDDEPLLPP